MMFTLGVLNPLAEELHFRGLGWVAAQRAFGGQGVALIFTSVVFATLHHPVSFVLAGGYFGFAVIVGCVRIRTRGVVAPIVAHVTCNVVGVGAVWFGPVG